MNVKLWVFRVIAAVLGVAVTAVAGIHTDMAHFGPWFALVAAIQTFVLAFLGNLIKKWQ